MSIENGNVIIRVVESDSDDMFDLINLCLTDFAIIQSFYDMSKETRIKIEALALHAELDSVHPLEVMRNEHQSINTHA